MSLRSVAQGLGVSASLISQVETGKSRPSVATLYALAKLLEISIDDLLGLQSGPSQNAPVPPVASLDIQRRADNPVIEMENGVRWERLAVGREGPAEALLVSYQPDASSSLEGKLMRHSGIEYAYILEGVISLQLEFAVHELGPGDSLAFDSTRPHMFSNHGQHVARGIWFMVGRRGFDMKQFEATSSFPATPDSALAVLRRIDSLDQATGQ